MKKLWNETFKPMLLDEIPSAFDSDDYIFEMKFDGIRALIYVSPNEFKIMSRNLVDMTKLFPELLSIKHIVKEKVIFDGEIICTENGVPSFSKLQERIHLKNKSKIDKFSKDNPVIFTCFDIIYKNKNLVDLSLLERKEILGNYKDTDYFIKTKYTSGEGIKLFNSIKKNKLEGIVAKLKNSKYYVNTRTHEWIKIKNFIEEIFYIGGYCYIKDSHVFSVILGEYINNELLYVGRVFIAKKNKLFNQIKKEKRINSKFVNYDDDKIIYIKPRYKIVVKYIERTKSNHLRQPFYVRSNDE